MLVSDMSELSIDDKEPKGVTYLDIKPRNNARQNKRSEFISQNQSMELKEEEDHQIDHFDHNDMPAEDKKREDE